MEIEAVTIFTTMQATNKKGCGELLKGWLWLQQGTKVICIAQFIILSYGLGSSALNTSMLC